MELVIRDWALGKSAAMRDPDHTDYEIVSYWSRYRAFFLTPHRSNGPTAC